MNEASTQRRTVLVKLNFPVPPLKKEEIRRFVEGNLLDIDRFWLEHYEDFLGFSQASFTKAIIERVGEIITNETAFLVVPVVEKILKPLKDACLAYCLGIYSGSLALSGMTAESLQVLLWEMYQNRIKNDDSILVSSDKVLFGKKFQDLTQYRRISILSDLGWITSDQRKLFHSIRNMRNAYLHPWNQDFRKEKEDALKCYQYDVRLFKEITGVGLADAGSINIDPIFQNWMDAYVRI